MLSSKLKRLIKYKRNFKNASSSRNESENRNQDKYGSRNRSSVLSKFQQESKGPRENEEKETRKCFKCGRIGQLCPDCPSRKEHREQGLVVDVPLSDTDSDSDSDDQKIQGHMALTDGESSDAENQEKTGMNGTLIVVAHTI
ncbi:hypothetical protein LINGRAHAP2_LOCUS24178 [Linum grandiflorum]